MEIVLHVFSSNPRTVRVYERLGFRHEGTLRRDHFVGGRYVDTLIVGLLVEEFDGASP